MQIQILTPRCWLMQCQNNILRVRVPLRLLPICCCRPAAYIIGQGRGGTVSPARFHDGGRGVRLGRAGVGGPRGVEAAGGALRELAGVSEVPLHFVFFVVAQCI